jgi:methionyl-tRNA formyltransferase
MRIIFMGTPDFALPSLRSLAEAHDVVAVYTAPPRPANRGKKLSITPVHELANELGLPIFTPPSLKDSGVQAEFAALSPDIAVVVAYGLLLPKAILEAPRLGCLNIHPSDLPRWRGAAPIQRSLMAGDAQTAICVMQMEAGLDTGAVWARQYLDVPHGIIAPKWEAKLAELSAKLLLQTLAEIEAGSAVLTPQSDVGVCYAHKIDKCEYELRFDLEAQQIINHIHGLSPYAYINLHGERIRIIQAEMANGDALMTAGVILDAEMRINCIDGMAINPTLLQRAGKNPMSLADFLRGYSQNIAGVII